MQLISGTLLLFALNLLDGILTLVWVRSGVATETNELMANLLDRGDFVFLAAKIGMGLFTAFVLIKWGHGRRLATYGLSLALLLYIGLMGVHVLTGLAAFGYVSGAFFHDFELLSNALFAFVM
jgi:hypothetical protein